MKGQQLFDHMEKMVISEIVFAPHRYDEISEILSYEDFTIHVHRMIFKIFGILRDRGDAITTDSVVATIAEFEPNISSQEVLSVLTELPASGVNKSVEQIKNESMKRQIRDVSSYMREESLKGGVHYEQILQETERRIYDLSNDDLRSDFTPLREIAISTMKLVKEYKKNMEGLMGVNTGFRELNYITTGFNPGELIIIGARPSMGKTALILSMALKAVSSRLGVALFSLEMPAEHLMLRMLSARSQIPLQTIRSGQYDDNQLRELSAASQSMLDHGNFYIDDNPNLTISTLRSKLRRLKRRDPTLGIVFLDYLQIMSDVKSAKDSARHEFIAEVSRSLKLLAREIGIPIVALSQLNRSLDSRDDKRPILSDLRDSGAIEQDADIILFLYRDAVYKERESRHRAARAKALINKGENVKEENIYKAPDIEDVEIIIAKNRNGETRTIIVKFNKPLTLFEDKGEGMATIRSIGASNNNNISIDQSGMPNVDNKGE